MRAVVMKQSGWILLLFPRKQASSGSNLQQASEDGVTHEIRHDRMDGKGGLDVEESGLSSKQLEGTVLPALLYAPA